MRSAADPPPCGSGMLRNSSGWAEANLEMFHRLHEEKGVNTIVSSCAGCYRAIKKDYILAADYDKMMDGIRVVHYRGFAQRLV